MGEEETVRPRHTDQSESAAVKKGQSSPLLAFRFSSGLQFSLRDGSHLHAWQSCLPFGVSHDYEHSDYEREAKGVNVNPSSNPPADSTPETC
jgi:hypothetical protein